MAGSKLGQTSRPADRTYPLPRNKTIAAVVVAAGSGVRASDGHALPKQFRPIAGVPLLRRTIDALLADEAIDLVQPVIGTGQDDNYAALGINDGRVLPPVTGGANRQASVLAGLEALAGRKPDYILIQDAARPFLDQAITAGVLASLTDHDGALPVVPVTDTIKRTADGKTVAATEDRRTLFAAQTPQGFRFPQILSAHMRASRLPREFTDDAEVAEWAGLAVALTPGSTRNIKITHSEDFERAERMLGGGAMETRVGSGYDVHPFEPGDAVWLGGVAIPHTAKLKGHSDADVALHALCDAIYGALGEGDIGQHFPPSEPQWKGEPSVTFLRHAAERVQERHGRIVSLDITIVAEAPRIGPHAEAMKSVIGDVCGVATSRIAIKATTSEGLGFIGRREGIVAMATAAIEVPRED